MADVSDKDVHHQSEKSLGNERDNGGLEALQPQDQDPYVRYNDIHGITPGDPFPPDPTAPFEEHQLTVRALLVGSVLGAVVGASNIYLGLKTGFTFGPQLFGAIFGFAILKPLSKLIGGIGPRWLTGDSTFGPKENVTVQTAATAAGGIGIIFVSAIPAMYRLGLLSQFPNQDVGRLIALTCAVAFFGVFFVIPLRKYYILKMKLVFPTPTATAYTIRSLHSIGGAIAAQKKARMLGFSFLAAFFWKVLSNYAPGILWDWHIGWTMYRIGFTSMIQLDNYGWWLEFTPAFYGAGMLSGMNASWSFFMGTVLAWGVIAPATIRTGATVGLDLGEDNRVSYLSLKLTDISQYSKNPSPRYWLIWPGVLIMLVYSFVEVTVSSRHAFYKLGVSATSGFGKSYRDFLHRNDPNYIREIEDDNDPAPLEDRVPTWAWTSGLLLSVVLGCALCTTQFHMNVGEVILALILGFLLSFLAVQSAGDTDINPVSTVAKATQLIFGGIGKGKHMAAAPGQRLNLVAGVIAGASAAQASDMTGDLKTGHLVGAKPKNQFVAQLVGAVVAIFLNVGLFILFTKSAPCILYPDPKVHCSYGAPRYLLGRLSLSPYYRQHFSSGYTAIALSIVAAITVLVKHLYIPANSTWVYVPNWNAIGLAFIVPQIYYPLIMAIAATVNWFWERGSPSSFDMYGFPLASGLVAGEGIGGVMVAILAVAGVDGSHYGTAIGCPSMEYCG
ncbi:hypothetical protein BS47DRAFT_1396579 [Hydnum rufescens UP504]|uniref:Oligopeptide transporter n=1 Tax=Hydnum rufescens UP504 TaxID=1448309 RepID=A0A9P6APX6_9AGAM|nr:hypothetical protein BS47DRAFT_1396579 [Hydnum rufescens UP504]